MDYNIELEILRSNVNQTIDNIEDLEEQEIREKIKIEKNIRS